VDTQTIQRDNATHDIPPHERLTPPDPEPDSRSPSITSTMSTMAYARLNRVMSQLLPNLTRGSGKASFSSVANKFVNDNDVCIVSAVRTPMGSFGGSLSSLAATQLGSATIKAAVQRAQIDPKSVDEVIFGAVLQSNLGQAPARQAAVGAGLAPSTICTTVNKVCSSGLKAVMLAANEIRLGQAKVIVAGGMESMSNVPYYSAALRNGARIGDSVLIDGLMKDGLTDAYGKFPMGNCAEVCADEMQLTREDQDAYAIESYTRAQRAVKEGKFVREIVPIEVKGKKGTVVVDTDEEPFKVDFAKLPSLKPAFKHPTKADAKLTVTAGNASVLSDGAAALVLVSGKYAKEANLPVIARILSYADYEQDPVWFTTAPSKAIPKALELANVKLEDVSAFEINEAFSAVALANCKILNLDRSRVNQYGGAVALGHPLGASGARILVTLLSVLKQEHASAPRRIGVAGICNGGGGASALVVESLE